MWLAQVWGKSSSNFFLNLEKQRGPQSKIEKLLSGNIEIVDEIEISKELKKKFIRNFMKKHH